MKGDGGLGGMLRGWARVGDCEGGTHVDLKATNKVTVHAGAVTTLGEATHTYTA